VAERIEVAKFGRCVSRILTRQTWNFFGSLKRSLLLKFKKRKPFGKK